MENNPVENKVRQFYEKEGWTNNGTVSRDAALWEDLRPCAEEYVRSCRRRILAHLPATGERFLDAASGPIQYPEYLEYSWTYGKRVCVDISLSALKQAEAKLGESGEYVLASILELPLADKSIDAGVSLHTIYHIDKDLQEAAVRQLLRVMKPGSPLVVIYANPQRIFSRLKRLITRRKPDPNAGPIYYFAHPTDWWQRFSDTASVEIYPWRSLAAQDSRFIIPNNFLGRWMLAIIFRWERAFPAWALNWGAYPMIVLKRKAL